MTEEKGEIEDKDGLKGEKYEKILKEALKRFRIAYEAESHNRELAIDDINFRHGDQWEEGVKRQRELEQRPCLTINKLEQRVDQVTGDQRQSRMGIMVRPLNVTESNGNFSLSEVYSGIIKNIEASSDAKGAYDTAFDHAAGHGFGYIGIYTDYSDETSFDQEIKFRRIANSMRVYLDPSAEQITKIDAMWGFITTMVDKDEYEGASWERGRGEDYELWYEGEKTRIAEYFRRVETTITIWMVEGKTIKVRDDNMDIRDELTGQGIKPEKTREVETYKVEWYKLSSNEVFEKKDFPSKYIPIIPVYGKELNVKGKTYYRGVIRHAKDPQRIYNYTRTASVEQVSLAPKAPWVIEENQIGNHKTLWETANVKNHPMLVYKNKPGVPPPQRQMPPQPSSGWISESSLADQDIDASSGMYKASLGAPSNERSGKAINARKIEGDVGTFAFHDNLARSLKHVGIILIDMIPRVYDTQRIVRIKTPDEQEKMVEINQQIFDDESRQWVKMYDLTQGKYDIVVDVGASYTTQRVMAAESMMEALQFAPVLAPQLLDLIAKNLDWPGADAIAERLKKKTPTEEEIQQAIQQAVQEALKNQDFQLEQFKAMTDRMAKLEKADTDEARVKVELLRILNDNGIQESEIANRAMELMLELDNPPMGESSPGEQSGRTGTA